MSGHGWKKYMESELQTSNGVKITIMAYEKCILELRRAKEMIEYFHYANSEQSLVKVERIIQELSLQLNHEDLPELSGKIHDLYVWLIDEINVVKQRKAADKIDPMIHVLQNLLDGYRGVQNNGNN